MKKEYNKGYVKKYFSKITSVLLFFNLSVDLIIKEAKYFFSSFLL